MTLATEVATLTTAVNNIKSAVATAKPVLDDRASLGVGHKATAKGYQDQAKDLHDNVVALKETAYSSLKDIKSIKNQDLSILSSSKAHSAVDLFIYDTSKDSDGGAWRNRTQSASWYKEQLGTTTRGYRKEFPSVAVIVTDGDELIIYDGDDPAMPMWFTHTVGGGVRFATDGYGFDISTLTARDGKIFVGLQQESTNEVGVYGGVLVFDYVADTTEKYAGRGSGSNRGVRDGVRFTDWGGYMNIIENDNRLVDGEVNDVAVTVLDGAPIDPDTGLPVPTIAVATDRGVSVIKDDGNIFDISGTNWALESYMVQFGKDGILFFAQQRIWLMSCDVKGLNEDYTLHGDGRAYYRIRLDDYPFKQVSGYNPRSFSLNKGIAVSMNNDFDVAYPSVTTDQGERLILSTLGKRSDAFTGDKQLSAHIDTKYNTGWMHGNIQVATLAEANTTDIDSTDLVSYFGSNLVTNGDFSTFGSDLVSNGDFSNGTTDWTVANTSTPLSVNNGRLRVTEDGAQYTARAIQILACEVGKSYRVSFDIYPDVATGSSGKVYISESSSLAQDKIVNNSGMYSSSATGQSFCFTATTTSPRVIVIAQSNLQSGDFCEYDNIKVEEITGWTLEDGWSVDNGKATVVAPSGSLPTDLKFPISSLTVGDVYKIQYTISGSSSDPDGLVAFTGVENDRTISSDGTYVHYFTASQNNQRIEFRVTSAGAGGDTYSVENVSVQRIQLDQWTESSTTVPLSIVNGKIRVTEDGGEFTARGYQQLATVVGKTYQVTADIDPASGNSGNIYISTNTSTSNQIALSGSATSSETVSFTFTATTASHRILLTVSPNNVSGSYADFSNISIKEIVADRSVSNLPFYHVGSGVIDAEPVATGAELTSFKGDYSNWLAQPYNSALDVIGDGTASSYTFMGWFKSSTAGSHLGSQVCILGNDLQNSQFISFVFQGSDGAAGVWAKNTTGTASYTTETTTLDQWNHVVWVNSGSNEYKIYINGKFAENITVPYNKFPTDITNRQVILCKNVGVKASLAKLSLSVPTAEEISKIYRDEKPLFQEGAKCTLYGTSDNVEALDYDTGERVLHAGTSSGASHFSGLQRINNTTDAVTLISANNGLVIEE